MLAIVIPYYKLTFFEATLKSLASQTDKRFKVYIGDDNSPESPFELLENYKGEFEFDYHKFEDNLGSSSLTKQWERCVKLSSNEEWIMILGDDDVLTNDVVSNWYKFYLEFNTKANVIRFASVLINADDEITSDKFIHPIWEKATESFYRKFLGSTRSSLSEHIFSKESFKKHGFYNYQLAWNSDDRAWLEFSEDKPIYTINESLVHVRISTINISGKGDNYLVKNRSLLEFYKFLISKKLSHYSPQQRTNILRNYGKNIKKYREISFLEYVYIIFYSIKYFNLEILKKGLNVIRNKYKIQK